MSNKDSEIETMRADLSSQKEQLAKLLVDISEKDTQLTDMKKDISWRNDALAENQLNMRHLQTMHEDKAKQLAEKDKQLTDMKQSMSDKDSDIALMRADLTSKGEQLFDMSVKMAGLTPRCKKDKLL